MGDLLFNEFVGLRNCKNCPVYKIPTIVADLLQKELTLTTGGTSKHGLRWQTTSGRGVIYMENISRTNVDLYVLPSSISSWRTPEKLEKLLFRSGFSNITEQIGTANRGGKDLRIKNLSWAQAYPLIPLLARWSYSSQTGRDL